MKKNITSKFNLYLYINILLFILCIPVWASQNQVENNTSSKPFADYNKIVNIGVLAKCGYDACTQRWNLTAEYLTQKIQGYDFKIIPLEFDEILPTVENNSIDFILANPAYYVMLEYEYGCERIATLYSLTPVGNHTKYAGVVFTRADNKDIQSLSDLKNKKIYGCT